MALTTDWSKLGIAFWLCQKTCYCTGDMPGCCDTGLKTVLFGRFCSPAESQYSPIEGEGLACMWGFEKCKFYLLGMKNFTLTVDHNPLVRIFGQQEIMEIPNPCLTSQKIKIDVLIHSIPCTTKEKCSIWLPEKEVRLTHPTCHTQVSEPTGHFKCPTWVQRECRPTQLGTLHWWRG